MDAWAVFYFLFSILFFVVPYILVSKVFKEKNSVLGSYFSLGTYYFVPLIGLGYGLSSANNELFDDSFVNTLAWVMFVMSFILGLCSIFLFSFLFKFHLKKFPDILPFTFAFGGTGGYGFYCYFFIGFLMTLLDHDYLEDDEDIIISITFHKHAFAYFVTEFILLTGNFFSLLSLAIIQIKNLSKAFLCLLTLLETTIYTLHIVYLFNFKAGFVVFIIIIAIIEVCFGLFIFKNYYNENDSVTEIKENNIVNSKELVTKTQN